MTKKHIEDSVRETLEQYFKDLHCTEPRSVHAMVVARSRSPCWRW